MNEQSIILEPALEELAGHLTAHDRVMLAKKFYRWSRQLYISARILRRGTETRPRRGLRALPRRRLTLN